ncbi:hypothetical protein EJ08DRAFT_372068 [Tothia fuscella]|uniref:Uncharacterized protein n=1 Tax=Tothia fuscella TaxID=1048955 RepID=A0A9P4TV04_9PEZI|nr:hypothetical protein EJ08DRAFT_372068 [Tothia fuscella]
MSKHNCARGIPSNLTQIRQHPAVLRAGYILTSVMENGQRESYLDGTSQTPSADSRQPQYNSTNCGCCRNCVQGEGGDGDHGESDTHKNYMMGEEGAKCEAPVAIVSPMSPLQSTASHFDTRYADFEVGPNGFSYGHAHIHVVDDPFHVDINIVERTGSPISVMNEMHSSDEPSLPSLASSGSLTRLEDDFNGMGKWTEYYFFTTVPLPLVPQWQISTKPRFQPVGDREDEYPKTIESEDSDDNFEDELYLHILVPI